MRQRDHTAYVKWREDFPNDQLVGWYWQLMRSVRWGWHQFYSHQLFDITREDVESWYEWFYGEDIGGRFPPPEDHILAIAERNAWRKIHEKMHEGNTLKAAMLAVRQDTLFWTREVYEKIKTFSRGRPPTRTSMDYAPPQKGKKKSKDKPGKGRARAVTSRQPPTRKGTSSATTGCAGGVLRATAAAPTSATSS